MKIAKKRIYLDHASTTPVDPKVLKAVLPFLKEDFYNPSALYIEGVAVKKKLEVMRKQCADLLKAHADEIIFTSGGTESNNLIIQGVLNAVMKTKEKKGPLHIVTSSIEHPSILEVCRQVEKRGCSTLQLGCELEVTYLPVDEKGLVDPKEVRKALKENTVLVSIQYANNEIGTIEPIREIAKAIRHFKKEQGKGPLAWPYFHTDASQAALHCDLNVILLGVDLMTLDSSKLYAPKGTGLAYAKRGVKLSPLMYGGGQENDLRPGTENVPGIEGFTEGLILAEVLKIKESKRLQALKDYASKEILQAFPKALINGAQTGDKTESLPNILNVCFPGLDAEYAVFQLDARGISCSSVTSCRNLAEDSSSYVAEALGRTDCAKSSLRFSMGRSTTKADINSLISALKEILK